MATFSLCPQMVERELQDTSKDTQPTQDLT